MGDPRRIRKKYQGPRHPWNKERIEEEKALMRTYGLVNKKELWKAQSKLKNFKDITKKLIAQTSKQSEKERTQLFKRLQSLGLIGTDATADDVLGLRTEQLLDRRLQTLVYKHQLARSIKQARQFITHGHIMVGNRKVTVPGYLVPVSEESLITFTPQSKLSNPDHPERIQPEQASKEEVKSEKARAQEEAPVTKTKETPEEEKPLEEQIEDETSNAQEVKEAVEEAEADNIAADHEEEVKKEAAEEAAQ